MLVLGIDPGLAITGYGFLQEDDQGNIRTVKFGVIRTSSKIPIPQRLRIIYSDLQALIRLHKPDCGSVEKLFFQKNVRTAINVGQARGVAILALSQAEIPVFEYNPLEIKQAVTGYGGADKMQMQLMIKALLNLDSIPKPDDAADALAVGLCHLNSAKMRRLFDSVDETT
ncbi:MAG: crossover junction endodeoxyribonuclease RuvC [Anaerolineales bacterium]|nr:crossover junction endodeoxyribonuclease RuvC [Anaerolineales bacterium]